VQPFDHFDVLAIIFGVMFALRKLDAKAREPGEHPHVPKDEFERWQRAATRAYGIGSVACFFRVTFHFAWVYYVNHNPVSLGAFRAVGLTTDILWLGGMAVALVKARAARKLRDRLNIGPRPPKR
jgi:hypothetical protein